MDARLSAGHAGSQVVEVPVGVIVAAAVVGNAVVAAAAVVGNGEAAVVADSVVVEWHWDAPDIVRSDPDGNHSACWDAVAACLPQSNAEFLLGGAVQTLGTPRGYTAADDRPYPIPDPSEIRLASSAR